MNKLDNIIYISVPEHIELDVGGFTLDRDRLLPVESTSGADRYNIEDLSWEQIVAAMLKILAYAPHHDDADYYREFITTISPDLITDLTQTAILKTRNGDLEVAEEIFLALCGLQPHDIPASVNLALLYEQVADRAAEIDDDASQEAIEKVLEIYHRVFAADDVPAEAHLNAGYFYARHGEPERALEHLRAYCDEGDDDEKIEEARRLIDEIESQNLSDTQFKEAYDFIRMGREADGIERIREFLASHPTVWNGWFVLGWGLRRMERYADARDAFNTALEHGPRRTDTLNELAICSMELGELDTARDLLIEALRQEPENTKIISNLGIVSLRQERTTDAEGFFRAVLEIDPSDPIATSYLAELNGQ
ncbi:MAG: hypothetical protein EA382_14875 [Spirochaetaceae bacterium]|nr:MAG: hypothetical protein EA382_14875 [Spirochaetaceae bacterium]